MSTYNQNNLKTPAPWDNFSVLVNTLEQVEQITGRPGVFIDFEFNRSQEPNVNPVCCTIISTQPIELGAGTYTPGTPIEIWLHNRVETQEALADLVEELKPLNPIYYSYAVPAEARSFMALTLDPHGVEWVDLFAEWRQLCHNNYSCQYGTYFTKNGYRRHSVPPSYDKRKNRGKDNNEIGLGMVDCVGQMFGVWINSVHKNEMRDLIISDPPEFTPEERIDIQAYCTTDVKPLPFIFLEQFKRIRKATGMKPEQVLEAQLKRSSYMVSIAKMEQIGFPVDVPKIRQLRANYEQARNEIIQDLVTNHYHFYRRDPIGPKTVALLGDWVDSYEDFVQFLDERHPDLKKDWPVTIDQNTGKPTETLSRAEDTLEKYDGIPEIYAYRQCKKNIKQLAWFKEPDAVKKKKDGDFFDHVGSDGRLRAFLGAYGTQTGRNAPKASRFILAMANWLRCLIQAPAGRSIIAIDYASQEFAIAAIMSGDRDMVAAYRSGDPYLYFAKKAGAVPQNADPKKCKNPSVLLLDRAKEIEPDIDVGAFFGHGCPQNIKDQIKAEDPDLWAVYLQHLEYARQRDLFKSTTLGLQYGMGAEKLAAKLTADMGELITKQRAEVLIALHKKTYPTYWRWLDKISNQYKRAKTLILADGWALLGNNDNSLSVRNFPVQGTGAVIMREAVRLGHLAALDILSPLHDAIYTETDIEEEERNTKILAECMLQAVVNILGDKLEIRLDIDHHRHGETWIEPKGRKYYEMLNKYLKPREAADSELEKILRTIYAR